MAVKKDEEVIKLENDVVKLEDLKKDQQYARILGDKINRLNVSEANKIVNKLLYYCEANNLIKAYPWFLNEKGWIYYKNMDFKKAEIYHKKAFNLFKNQNNNEGVLICINPLIADYSMDRKYDLAIEWALKGLELAEKYNNQERLTAIKMNMAGIYMELGEYSKSKEVLDEIEKAAYFESKDHEAISYLNKAECERKLKNLDESVRCIKRAYEISREYAPKILFNVLTIKANIYVEKKWYFEAEAIYKECLSISKEGKSYIWVVEVLFNWIKLDLKQSKFDNAILKLQEIDKIRDEKGASVDEMKFCKLANKAYKGLKIYERAYFYLERYVHLEKEKEKNKSDKLKNLDVKKQDQIEKTYKVLYKQTEALYEVGQKITSNLEKEDILDVIIKELEKLIEFNFLQLSIYDEKTSKYKCELVLCEKYKMPLDNQYINENTFSYYCIKNKKDILIRDVVKEYKKYITGDIGSLEDNKINRDLGFDKTTKSLIFVPIVIRENIIGVISVQSYDKNKYTLKDLTTLKILSTYIGIALENSRLYKTVKYSATHDVLTNIYNRSEVLKRYYQLYNNAKEKLLNLAVMMIDIDNFKNINDIYGHQCGDEVIRKVAETIRMSIRKCDIVGRYGGEEFIIVINNTDDENTLSIAERIRENIEKLKFNFENNELANLTISIGATKINDCKMNPNKIIGLADKALYKAKNTGKNKVVILNK